MRYLRVLWVFLRINILNEFAYRGNLLTQFLRSLLSLGTGLMGLTVIFAHTSSLNGWRSAEVLALLGVYLLVGGVIDLVIQPAMQQLMRDVQQGTLDHTLLKPGDAQFLVSIRQMSLWKMGDIVLGMSVIVVSLAHLGTVVGWEQLFAFVFMLAVGSCIVYSFWLTLATWSFWLVRVENILVIFQDMYQAGRWPVSIYPSWLRWILTFLVPVTVATTFPVQALIGQLTWPTFVGTVTFAVGLLCVSRWFWLCGLRHYTGASA
jgi:ABC-2 type transport system permease protein